MAKSRKTLNHITDRNVQTISAMDKAIIVERTFGERVADSVTGWVGSWRFLIIQTAIFALWMFLNVIGWWKAWDPYPFILLNLLLSFQAAYAMPIVMMSQNRQARIAERHNQLDLQINLLAEQENTTQLRLLRMLCEKNGIKLDKEHERVLEETTRPDQIVQQIDKTNNEVKTSHGRASERK